MITWRWAAGSPRCGGTSTCPQVAFARRIGIARNTLLDYERGNRMPRSTALARIAEASGVSVDWLLNGHATRTGTRDVALESAISAISALRVAWRYPQRRRLALAVLRALALPRTAVQRRRPAAKGDRE